MLCLVLSNLKPMLGLGGYYILVVINSLAQQPTYWVLGRVVPTVASLLAIGMVYIIYQHPSWQPGDGCEARDTLSRSRADTHTPLSFASDMAHGTRDAHARPAAPRGASPTKRPHRYFREQGTCLQLLCPTCPLPGSLILATQSAQSTAPAPPPFNHGAMEMPCDVLGLA